MDTSISDILESVTRAHRDTVAASSNGFLLQDTAQQQQDLQLLTRAWVSERVAPELLPFPTDLVNRVMARIRQQIESIEDRTARMDAGTSFSLVIVQTELERFKFLIRSFLRARLAKIDAHSLHILALYQSQPQDNASPLLSPQEFQYLSGHAAILEKHYTASFLGSFPQKLRSLEDRTGSGGVGMVEGPDLDRAVFVRCLGVAEDNSLPHRATRPMYDFDDDMLGTGDEREEREPSNFRPVEVSCGFTAAPTQHRDASNSNSTSSNRRPTSSQQIDGERTVRMRRGEIWLIRWSAVREAVTRGECELI